MAGRLLPTRRAPTALLACALLAACQASPVVAVDGDYLTDLADDGSLVRGLESPDPRVRCVAARGLARLPQGDAGPAAIQRLVKEQDEDVLVELLFAFGQWHDRAAAYQVVALTEHAAPRVRAAAYEALGRMQDDRWTPEVVAGLRDADALVRGTAALALFALDGRRYDHARTATEAVLDARDNALWTAARHDPDAGVRWRAVYTIGAVRGREQHARILRSVLDTEPGEPLVLVFALRGLRLLATVDGYGSIPGPGGFLDHPDERVAVEATENLVARGDLVALLAAAETHSSAHVRRVAVEGAGAALAREPVPDALLAALERIASADASAVVRREAAAAIARSRAPGAGAWLEHLVHSPDRRDRERAGALLVGGDATDDALLARLLADAHPTVRAAALPALSRSGLDQRPWVTRALQDDDPAVIVGGAEFARERVRAGHRDAWLMQAVGNALHRLEQRGGPRMLEARQALRGALDLDVPDPRPQLVQHEVPLLERLQAVDAWAARDPYPLVLLETTRGPIALELDRVTAPRHVTSFLELARSGFYDGLDFHRVVPDFVVQGLDPRGDGWGTGDRRLPDEFAPIPFVTGTLGMPNAGTPHSGGCQIFLTHVPAPHLDGRFTVFGQVVGGAHVVQAIEIGDVVTQVRRIDADELAERFAAADGTGTAADAADGETPPGDIATKGAPRADDTGVATTSGDTATRAP